MADKVKLTPPMTDSKTPEWAAEASRIAMDIVPKMALTFDHSHGLKDYDERKAAELPFRQIAQHDITPALSQSLLSAYERGRKEGIEEAAKVATKQAPATQDWADAPLQDQARRTATAIRQLLEGKG